MVNEIELMHTEDCHLCEQASEMMNDLGLEFKAIDIASSAELIEAYGLRIPVIRVSGQELGWPFDPSDIQAFLSQIDKGAP